jgi:hypothetical protein
MELKKEDFKKFRIVDTFFYALPVSLFEAPMGDPIMEKVEEAMEEKKDVEIEIVDEKIVEEPEPTEEELAEIEKEKKRAEL